MTSRIIKTRPTFKKVRCIRHEIYQSTLTLTPVKRCKSKAFSKFCVFPTCLYLTAAESLSKKSCSKDENWTASTLPQSNDLMVRQQTDDLPRTWCSVHSVTGLVSVVGAGVQVCRHDLTSCNSNLNPNPKARIPSLCTWNTVHRLSYNWFRFKYKRMKMRPRRFLGWVDYHIFLGMGLRSRSLSSAWEHPQYNSGFSRAHRSRNSCR